MIAAGVKIIALIIAMALLIMVREPWQLGIGAVVIGSLYWLAGISVRVMVGQVWSLRWFIVILAAFQWIVVDWRQAVLVCGSLLLAVLAAGLVTLTTRTTEMLDLTAKLLGPFRRLGVDPDRVGLLLALTIRAIPLITEIIAEVLEARRARGVEWSLRALAVPVVVRCLRTSDALGEALIARGVDD